MKQKMQPVPTSFIPSSPHPLIPSSPHPFCFRFSPLRAFTPLISSPGPGLYFSLLNFRLSVNLGSGLGLALIISAHSVGRYSCKYIRCCSKRQ